MLKETISNDEIKKIFGNADRKKKYLKRLYKELGVEYKIPSKKEDLDYAIISTWSYETSKTIIRNLYFNSEKYFNAKRGKSRYNNLISQWKKKEFGALEWPFAANNFDDRVAKLNRENISESKKDKIITNEVVKFRRIKQINTLRNDFIENLIIENNSSIVPTLVHNKRCDFYIDGVSFDQKVSRSVGKEFTQKHGNNYRDFAIDHPDEVAKSLYENQDAARFGAENRLYVVFLDSEISIDKIESKIKEIDFSEPHRFIFEYKDKDGEKRKYSTECFVILLHN